MIPPSEGFLSDIFWEYIPIPITVKAIPKYKTSTTRIAPDVDLRMFLNEIK
ncbi:hypothetical protein GCM10007096_12220 [Pullulanibacillus pueri]|uniref:Uncharacterized protein n=1 Tax=Pullulanibacillus pueri TaxID=1437324 RepID=A0A8J2ZUL1_9BACL|nr:hypothetical protein GCM10007096_12220 [Pullulanibacillus pueri]